MDACRRFIDSSGYVLNKTTVIEPIKRVGLQAFTLMELEISEDYQIYYLNFQNGGGGTGTCNNTLLDLLACSYTIKVFLMCHMNYVMHACMRIALSSQCMI